MTNPTHSLVQEIRINPKYTQYFLSEFPEDSKGTLKVEDESKPVIVKRTLFTDDYMKKISGTAGYKILPPNCRYIESSGNKNLVVIEEPPALRTIKIHKYFEAEYLELQKSGKLEEYGYKDFKYKTDSTRNFTLAFPYVIFILLIENETRLVDGMVFLRTQEMRGMSDNLFKAPLTNISNNQRVCFGDANKFQTYSLTQTIQNVIMVFWSATFNIDYTYNYEKYRNAGSEFGNYLRWEFLSRQNPLFIYDAKWVEANGNLKTWINKMKSDHHISGEKMIDYKKAADLIFTPMQTDKESAIGKKSKRKLPLYFDIANGIYVGEYFLSIGDPFINSRGEVLHIDSFIGFSDGGRIKYIMVDKGGKKFTMKFTRQVQNYIAASNKTLRYTTEMTLPSNNLKIKTDDILIFSDKHGGEHYGAVDFIRTGRDGRAEIKVGADYYIAENINATKFDMVTP
jgi:hypothetical protein